LLQEVLLLQLHLHLEVRLLLGQLLLELLILGAAAAVLLQALGELLETVAVLLHRRFGRVDVVLHVGHHGLEAGVILEDVADVQQRDLPAGLRRNVRIGGLLRDSVGPEKSDTQYARGAEGQ
jgi:hypothetical protein